MAIRFGDSKPAPIRPLLLELERQINDGELQHSELAYDVYLLLGNERHAKLKQDYQLNWLTAAIRLADSYFTIITLSAGTRDWQRDFATTATPLVVGATWCLDRSADSQAIMVQLCELVGKRLRLSLAWPNEPDDLNDLKNSVYRACLEASVLESDEVLLLLRQIITSGPA
ncbi:MAG: hypothetical protein R3C18_05655 [Planctomycetaceae bacterium]